MVNHLLKIKFYLPFPPSINNYYRRSGKRIHISKDGLIFKKKVFEIIKKNKLNLNLTQRLGIKIFLYPKDKRKFDIDNRLKVCLDSLQNAGVFLNDEQIDEIFISRVIDLKKKSQVLVKIKILDFNF